MIFQIVTKITFALLIFVGVFSLTIDVQAQNQPPSNSSTPATGTNSATGANSAATAQTPSKPYNINTALSTDDEGTWGCNFLLGFNTYTCVTTIMANIVNLALTGTSWLVNIAGSLLNVSIVLTLHIKDFVDSTPIIYTVWRIMRDLTGLFFIFFLLYAALRMIFGFTQNYGSLIKNIVIAGILVNFSFFIISVGIDASNVISQAIYNSMLPDSKVPVAVNTTLPDLLNNVTGIVPGSQSKAQISDIFMNALKVQSLHNNFTGKDIDPLKVFLIGIFGVIIMITTAISFVLAAGAFILRLVLLLFILAFSSIWVASLVIPQLKTHVSTISDTYKGMLLFMPVYLLVMYVALQVVNNSNLFGSATVPFNVGATSSPVDWAFSFIALGVNFVIVVIMLNLPLAIAASMGGKFVKFMADKKFDAVNMWKNVGGFAGTNLIGRTATWTNKKFGKSLAGNTYYGKMIGDATLGKVSKSKFGGSRTWQEKVDIKKDLKKKRAEIYKRKDLDDLLADPMSGLEPGKYGEIMKKMNDKERLALGAKVLKNVNVAKHLKKSEYEAVKKSDDFSDDEKRDIAESRKAAYIEAINRSQKMPSDDHSKVVEHMTKNMEESDILGLPDAEQTSPALIAHLKTSQLKKLADEGISDTNKRIIGRTIRDWKTNPLSKGKDHPAFGYIRKNEPEWT